jgi:phage shock protein C
MYCTHCGVQSGDQDNFCHECGQETPVGREGRRQPPSDEPRRLYRLSAEKKIAGVCAGLAQYFEVDATLVRLAVAAGTIFSGGLGLLAYIVAWIIMPSDRHQPPYRSRASTSTQTAA